VTFLEGVAFLAGAAFLAGVAFFAGAATFLARVATFFAGVAFFAGFTVVAACFDAFGIIPPRQSATVLPVEFEYADVAG
jgi:hypothetical protein